MAWARSIDRIESNRIEWVNAVQDTFNKSAHRIDKMWIGAVCIVYVHVPCTVCAGWEDKRIAYTHTHIIIECPYEHLNSIYIVYELQNMQSHLNLSLSFSLYRSFSLFKFTPLQPFELLISIFNLDKNRMYNLKLFPNVIAKNCVCACAMRARLHLWYTLWYYVYILTHCEERERGNGKWRATGIKRKYSHVF